MPDWQAPLPAPTYSLCVPEVARAQTSPLMSLPSSQCDSAWGTPYPDTTGVRLVARDLRSSSKPHLGVKNETTNNIWGSRTTASETFCVDMVFPESSGRREASPN